ncbi:MAG TPA: TldD/PmbA family protein [Acidimicrobiales bacterium]
MIEESMLSRVLGAALRSGGEFAEVFVEDRRGTNAVLDDGKVERVTSARDRGAGIRVVAGETTGFAHTADLSEDGLRKAAEAAAAAARSGGGGTRVVALDRRPVTPSPIDLYPEDVPKREKVDLLLAANSAAREAGPSIKQVSGSYQDVRRRILVANSDGLLAEDDQIRTLFAVMAVATGDTGMQTGMESLGVTRGFDVFKEVSVEDLAREAARQAMVKLTARPAPSGEVTVVIPKGTGGVMFHEACGHGLEADLIAKDSSVYRGKVGELVASPLVTMVDEPILHEWGTFAIDDEGHPAERSVLIEDGVLTDYMWDFLRARKEGRSSSGNGRRQTYEHLPMVRMTNTSVKNGTEDPAAIVADTKSGVYIAALGGGQVNTATGDFVFGMNESYLIENGEITEPLRNANLIGNGPEVLRNIDALGNDWDIGRPGMCGKNGQSVPVGHGNPTLRVTRLTVGGTAGG